MEVWQELLIEDINEANLNDIPESCRGCLYWEFPEDLEKEKKKMQKRDLEEKKAHWFVQTLKEFGACGKIVYYKHKPVGYAQYGPTLRLPRATQYESEHVGKIKEGVVFLSCLYIADKTLHRRGLGKKLLGSIVDDLRRRGFKAIETFARRSDANNPSGPLTFYIRNGFHIKDKTNPEFPLVRLYL